MIDWNRVAELQDEVGIEDFDDVVVLFLEEVEEVLTPLRANSQGANPAAVLHSLKGSAWNLGFRSLGSLCAELELKGSGPLDMSPVLAAYETEKAEFLANLPGLVDA